MHAPCMSSMDLGRIFFAFLHIRISAFLYCGAECSSRRARPCGTDKPREITSGSDNEMNRRPDNDNRIRSLRANLAHLRECGGGGKDREGGRKERGVEGRGREGRGGRRTGAKPRVFTLIPLMLHLSPSHTLPTPPTLPPRGFQEAGPDWRARLLRSGSSKAFILPHSPFAFHFPVTH